MKTVVTLGLVIMALICCACQSSSTEEIQLKASQRRAEEERIVQAMRASPIQPEGTKGIQSIEKLSKQN